MAQQFHLPLASMRLDKVLSFVGRAFIAAGILVFLFVAYQLWGTDISEARSQHALKSQIASFPTTSTTVKGTPPTVPTPTSTTVNTTPAPPPAPQGDAVAVISIPSVGVDKTV